MSARRVAATSPAQPTRGIRATVPKEGSPEKRSRARIDAGDELRPVKKPIVAPTLISSPKRREKATEPAAPFSSEESSEETEISSEASFNEHDEPKSTSMTSDPDSKSIENDLFDSTSEDLGMLGIGSRVYPPDFESELIDTSELISESMKSAELSSVEARIAELEAKLDGLIGEAPSGRNEPSERPRAHVDADVPGAESRRELLESDYYRKKWGNEALAEREGGIDDFGWDPDYESKLRPYLEFLAKRYFRVEVEGIENVPERGRAVIVANHSGALPFDGAMLRESLRLHHSTGRDLRWLAEDFIFYLPFIGVTMNRIGAVRACQENAQRLLETEHLVGVFPEGAEGIKKLYSERYQLQRFGRGGYIRLCLKTQSPIIPCAIIGAEESSPVLYRFDNLSRLLGLEYLPVTPTFPLLGPFGLLPAPTKWRILFGEPIKVSEFGPAAADDHVLVGRLSERVRSSISSLIDAGLRRRKSLWF